MKYGKSRDQICGTEVKSHREIRRKVGEVKEIKTKISLRSGTWNPLLKTG